MAVLTTSQMENLEAIYGKLTEASKLTYNVQDVESHLFKMEDVIQDIESLKVRLVHIINANEEEF